MAKKYMIMIILLNSLTKLFLFSQDSRKSIAWTGISGDAKIRKLSVLGEIENSKFIVSSRQDYFTVFLGIDLSLKNLRPGAGFSYWLLYTNRGMIIPEWRPHAQVEWFKDRKKYSLLSRLRLENRLTKDTANEQIRNTYNYFLRPRLMFQAGYFLHKQKDKNNNLQLIFYNELLINKTSRGSLTPENRAYLGLWYKLNRVMSFRLGYVWVISRETVVEHSDIIYFTFKNDFTLKK